jgi:hexosaminidase
MLAFIPQPQRITLLPGQFVLPGSVEDPGVLEIGVSAAEFAEHVGNLAFFLGYDRPRPERPRFDPRIEQMQRESMRLLGTYSTTYPLVADKCHIAIIGGPLAPERYQLRIDPQRITIAAGSARAVEYAGYTLRQIREQSPLGVLPCLEIDDWPDYAVRGLYYDVSRGRVPELGTLFHFNRQLAAYKLNQLQLYVEHTFSFLRHPEIGRDADPLTAEDMRHLDENCRLAGIELVPSLACFGHMSQVLRLPRYRHLAEDWGVGRYLDSAATAPEWGRGWSLAPANPEGYAFLSELFEEFLPCFSSRQFNVCCDETYDLGWGQSYELAQRIGKGRLYLSHLLRLRELAARHEKELMFWGDIVRSYPELIPELPREATVLDWGYHAHMDYERIRDFTAAGLRSCVCPSVSGFVTLFPRLHESMANIAGWARAGQAHGAMGLLNTDWGDGGHYNFAECAWPGYLFGAEQAWNVNADRASFLQRFCQVFLHIDNPAFTRALEQLGDVAQTHVAGFYQSFWRHVFFASPGDAILGPQPRPASISTQGEIREESLSATAAYGRETLGVLQEIGRGFAPSFGWGGEGMDPEGVLPYWEFSLDTLQHAARKLCVFGEGGRDTLQARRELREELGQLRERFTELWRAHNRKSEIGITLAQYDKAMAGLT